MHDLFENIMTEWKSLIALGAIVMLIIRLILGKLFDRIINACLKYILARWRSVWYLVHNKPFIVSGYIEYTFPKNITECLQLRGNFEKHLKENYCTDFQGSLDEGRIMIRLSAMRHINLILEFETGQEYIDSRTNNTVGDEITEGTLLEIKLDKIQIHYPEFVNVLNMLRQTSDNIKNNLLPLVENRASTAQSVFLEVFYRNDCKVYGVRVPVPLPDNRVSMTRLNNKLEIGSTNIDYIIPYFPKYLVKETLKSLIKGITNPVVYQ